MGDSTLGRLERQARLQVQQRETGVVDYELLTPEGRDCGLARLPAPSGGDLFFDMEGDALVEEGLEYLFGVAWHDSGTIAFRSFWGHDRAGEKVSFEHFIDFVLERRRRFPEMHVYHYASYEEAALKRLMGLHATREDAVDMLLREGVLVDLFRVVRQSVAVSQESYSIKKLEPLYMTPRKGPISDAGGSIVAYETWLETRDPRLLEEIEAYNRDDCISTLLLRSWLEERRVEATTVSGRSRDRPYPRDLQVFAKVPCPRITRINEKPPGHSLCRQADTAARRQRRQDLGDPRALDTDPTDYSLAVRTPDGTAS